MMILMLVVIIIIIGNEQDVHILIHLFAVKETRKQKTDLNKRKSTESEDIEDMTDSK